MSNVADIEKAIERLSPTELQAFREWFAEHDALTWDIRFELDAKNGTLDNLANEALKDVVSE